MKDYRLVENRREYFMQYYKMNLEHGVHPGVVYLYMPELKKRLGWDDEQALWFATLNGFTQNPITSMRMLEVMPVLPQSNDEFKKADDWFNAEWANLQFDQDRVKNKRNTMTGIWSYRELVAESGSQAALWTPGQSYSDLWGKANRIYSLGRLSTFSYLEYVYLNGFGADCTDLMFGDSGSRSHRNGMMFLIGADDKRMPNGFDGHYENFKVVCDYLDRSAAEFLDEFRGLNPSLEFAGNFTFESQLCAFKNGFFSRRYPGVYADMAEDRIKWYDERGMSQYTSIFKDIRAECLPDWLRQECETKPVPRNVKAKQFAETGLPYRHEYFMEQL
jgi:hypothetical protein